MELNLTAQPGDFTVLLIRLILSYTSYPQLSFPEAGEDAVAPSAGLYCDVTPAPAPQEDGTGPARGSRSQADAGPKAVPGQELGCLPETAPSVRTGVCGGRRFHGPCRSPARQAFLEAWFSGRSQLACIPSCQPGTAELWDDGAGCEAAPLLLPLRTRELRVSQVCCRMGRQLPAREPTHRPLRTGPWGLR